MNDEQIVNGEFQTSTIEILYNSSLLILIYNRHMHSKRPTIIGSKDPMSRLDELLSKNQKIYQNLKAKLNDINVSNININKNLDNMKPLFQAQMSNRSYQSNEFKQTHQYREKMPVYPNCLEDNYSRYQNGQSNIKYEPISSQIKERIDLNLSKMSGNKANFNMTNTQNNNNIIYSRLIQQRNQSPYSRKGNKIYMMNMPDRSPYNIIRVRKDGLQTNQDLIFDRQRRISQQSQIAVEISPNNNELTFQKSETFSSRNRINKGLIKDDDIQQMPSTYKKQQFVYPIDRSSQEYSFLSKQLNTPQDKNQLIRNRLTNIKIDDNMNQYQEVYLQKQTPYYLQLENHCFDNDLLSYHQSDQRGLSLSQSILNKNNCLAHNNIGQKQQEKQQQPCKFYDMNQTFNENSHQQRTYNENQQIIAEKYPNNFAYNPISRASYNNAKPLYLKPKLEIAQMLPFKNYIFIPFNKLYRSPIIQVKNPHKIIFARSSKASNGSAFNLNSQNKNGGKILDGLTYNFVKGKVATEQHKLIQQVMRVHKNYTLIKDMEGNFKNSVNIGIMGQSGTLKKKIHMDLLAYAYNDANEILRKYLYPVSAQKLQQLLWKKTGKIFPKFVMLHSIRVEVQHKQTSGATQQPTNIKNEFEFEISKKNSETKLSTESVFHQFVRSLDNLFTIIKKDELFCHFPINNNGNNKLFRMSKLKIVACYHLSSSQSSIAQQYPLQSRNKTQKDNKDQLKFTYDTIYEIGIICSNKYDLQFLAKIPLSQSIWCINPLISHYSQTKNTLQGFKQYSQILRNLENQQPSLIPY